MILGIVLALIFGAACIVGKSYPREYLDSVERYAKEYDVDPLLVLSIIKVESNFDDHAISRKGAIGVMQIMESTAMWISKKMKIPKYTKEMLYDSDYNIKMGTWYIEWLYDKYHNMDLTIVAYNAGPGNVDKWLSDRRYSSDGKNLDVIPFEETRNYILKVKFSYKVYKFLYG